jgi:signal transduction histidine kinase/DNA-binding response OmpR family regulator
MTSDQFQVLLIEDDPGFALLVTELLRSADYDALLPDYEITFATNLKESLQLISEKHFDVALIDLSLPDSFGLDTFRKIRDTTSHTSLIILTGNEDEHVAIQAVREGAQDYIGKRRADDYFLKRSIRYALERKQTAEKLRLHNQRLKALREIDFAILAADSIENIVDAALSHIRELINCNRASMALIDREANEALLFDVNTTLQTSLSNGMRIPAAAFEEMLEILSNNQSLVLNDLKETSDLPPQIQNLADEGFHSLCLLPLFSQGSLIGIFSMSSMAPNFFNEEKINFGHEVANQVAIAISQNNLLRDLRTLNANLEDRVAIRTEELNQLNIELEYANRAKDEFLATMSHELRTPLNSILGLSESLLEQLRDPLTEHQQHSLQVIESSGHHLLELINDVLDLSKIEAGKLDYYLQTVDVNILCRSSLAFVREQAARKSIQLVYEEDDKAGLKIHADPRRLKQTLVNLLTNAVKFTPEHGRVTLEINTDIEQDLIQFSVIDTGIGIAENDLKKLFQPFTQVDGKLNRQFEGTGLGLSLVQKMTDLHGGSVEVESESGKGSRFTLNLPWGRLVLAQQEVIETGGELAVDDISESSNIPSGKSSEGGTVLLAEDNMANLLTIRDYLESHGYEVVTVSNGLEAIKKAEEIEPHLILMDIQMPVLDGLEAIRRLRANSSFDSTPIIALTALAMSGDRERCLDAGANEYMSKPVSLKMLIKTINDLLKSKSK